MATSPYKNVSFYGQGPLNQIQRDYAPSMQMAQQLMANGSNTAPVQSPLEGIARALQGGLGGYTNYATMKAMGDRQTAANDAMIKALSGAKAKEFDRPTPDFVGPMQGSPGGLQGVIDAGVGTGNQDIMPFLQNAQMMKMQQDQAAQQAEIDRRNKLADAMTLKAAPGDPNSPTGRPASPIQISNKYDEVKAAYGEEAANTWLRKFGNTATIDSGGNISFRVDAADPNRTSGVPTIEKTLPPEQTPENKAAIKEAEGGAQAKIDKDKLSVKNINAMNAFKVGLGSIKETFANLKTDPITGRFPAMTSAAQMAEGSVSAMAPILKSLFREAGEGVFTDKDQELLTDMAPKRTDHPDVVAYKIDMIEKIVAAKLGQGAPATAAPGTIPPPPLGFN